jgi:hypothetical protein
MVFNLNPALSPEFRIPLETAKNIAASGATHLSLVLGVWFLVFSRREVSARAAHTRRPNKRAQLTQSSVSDFWLRITFGFRPSDFGFI